VLEELRVRFGAVVREDMEVQGCEVLVERGFSSSDSAEMAEIKDRRPALRHPDVVTVVLARMHGGTCLSSDGAVRKTCVERGIVVRGHVGCLQAAVDLLRRREARELLQRMLDLGLYLPNAVVGEFMY